MDTSMFTLIRNDTKISYYQMLTFQLPWTVEINGSWMEFIFANSYCKTYYYALGLLVVYTNLHAHMKKIGCVPIVMIMMLWNIFMQNENYVNIHGCMESFIYWLAEHLDMTGAISLGFAIPQVHDFFFFGYVIIS